MPNELTYTVVGKNEASHAFREAGRDASGMGHAVAQASKHLAHFSGEAAKKAAGAAKALALGVAGVTAAAGAVAVKVGKDAVSAASDFNETVSKSQAIFGKSSGALRAWGANSARAFGLSQSAALEGASQFGNFFNQIHIGTKTSLRMSEGLVKLSSDLASFDNADPAAVMESFQSATRGEYDSLQQFIPTITAATVQTEALRRSHKKSAKDLTDADKATALYAIAQRDAGKAQGDFTHTSHGLANQQRILKAQWKDIQGVIGSALLPGMGALANMTTSKLMPAIKKLAVEHGPQLSRWMTQLAAWIETRAIPAGQKFVAMYGPRISGALREIPGKIKELVASLKGLGSANTGDKVKTLVENIKDLKPILSQIKDSLPDLNSALDVTGTVTGFLADHIQTLKKWMPAIITAFVAWKVAQAAQNLAALAAVPIRIAEFAATKAHTAALREQVAMQALATGAVTTETVAETGNVAAKNAGVLASIRQRAATIASAVVTRTIAVVTGAWTAAQWLLNAAMSANPIGIIVLLLVGLGVALFAAYKKSDTFRRIVDGAFRAVGKAAMWLWNNAIKPAFGFIVAYFKWSLANIKAIWEHVLRPVFNAIGIAAKWLWEKGIKPAINNIRIGWSLFIAGLKYVWEHALKPVFNAIGAAVGWVKDKFHTAIDGIKAIWDRLKNIAAIPVRFVIDTVLNKGLIGGWNWISKHALGGKFHIDPIGIPFAKGGIYPGYTPGRDVGLAAVSGGEAIMRPEWTRAVGPAMIEFWNRAARNGGVAGVARAMGLPHYKDGGIFGGLKDFGSKVWDTAQAGIHQVTDFLSNPAGYIAHLMSGALSSLSRFNDTQLGRSISEVPRVLVAHVVDAAKSLIFGSPAGGGPANLGAPGGSSIAAIMAVARKFNPAATLSSGFRPGDPGYHGRGLAADIIGGGSAGMDRTAQGFMGISGRLLELIHSPSWFVKNGNRVSADYYRSVFSEHFNHVHVAANKSALTGLYDRGGYLSPGNTLAINRTGRAERVLAPHELTETLAAPIVLKLESEVVYRGLVRFKRRLGGNWELA